MIYSNLIDAEMNLFVGLNEYVHLVGKDDQYGGAHCSGIIRRMERRWLLAKEREPLSDLAKSISGKGAFAKIHRTEGFLLSYPLRNNFGAVVPHTTHGRVAELPSW